MSDKLSIGQRLKEAREAAGLSIDQMFERLCEYANVRHIVPRNISLYEQAETPNMRIAALWAWAKITNTSVVWLLGMTEKTPEEHVEELFGAMYPVECDQHEPFKNMIRECVLRSHGLRAE